jgi:hypothetical protein
MRIDKNKDALNSATCPWGLLALEYCMTVVYITDPYAPNGTYWCEHRAIQA